MCKTSTPRQAASAPADVRTLPTPGSPAASQPLLPFATAPYPTIGTPDDKFQAALSTATAAAAAAGDFGPGSRVAFGLIALATNGNHRYAGVFDPEMHFSASLVKVAAMYAAHELLAAARRLARKKGFADAAAFFSALSSTFDPAITGAAVQEVRDVVIDDPPGLMGHAPRYTQIFAPTNLGVANEPVVEFSPQFRDDLVSMIGFGTNDGASRCIRKLSYRYINAALLKGGFYTPRTSTAPENGIWLAGDYMGDKNKPKFDDNAHIRYVRTDCTNDCGVENGVHNCKVAQIATARRMANMFALIELGLIPLGDTKTGLTADGRTVPDSNLKMQALLGEPKPVNPATGLADVPWLDQSRLLAVTAQFTITKDKVGVADLKRGPLVNSEGLIIDWTKRSGDDAHLDRRKLSGKIAVCWQNLVGPPPGKNFDGIARVINQAFSKFIESPL